MGKKRLQKKKTGKEQLPDTGISFPNNFVIFLILFAVSLLVYGNSLHSPFIWDDPYLILDNHFVQSFRYLPEIFKHHLYYSTAGSSNFYRPLQTLFLTFDYALWKTNPFGYHLTSLLFHLLTAWAIFLIIELLFGKRTPAFLVSLLFLVHPVNSTVVDYIASRADSQAAAFVLLSFLFFFYHILRRKNLTYYLSSLLFFILALFSKEMAIILPFLILAGLYSVKRERLFYLKTVPFFVLAAIYSTLRLTVLNFSNLYSEGVPNLYLRLLTFSHSFVRLLGLIFFPLPIHIEKGI
ncbi:MAG: glycosyltransferase family 39 protein, partial [Candidatus Omnitrophota bacterium]